MPELDIERRPQPAVPWWAWLIGAILLALIIWAIVAGTTGGRQAEAPAPADRVAGERGETAGVPQPVPGQEGLLPVQAIQQNAEQYHGQTVSGTATVAEVVSNRGFWVEQNGNRLFVIDGQTTPPAAELRPGQQVHLKGYAYRTGASSRMPQVEAMDERTARTLQEQSVFLHVTEIQPVGEQTPAQ